MALPQGRLRMTVPLKDYTRANSMNHLVSATSLGLFLLAGCAAPPASNRHPEADAADVRRVPPSVAEALLPPLKSHFSWAPSERRGGTARFDIVASNAPAQQVFLSLISGSEYSAVLHPGVAGSITLALKEVTLLEALESLREVYGYEYRIDGIRVYVMPPKLETRLFHVKRQGAAPGMPASADKDFWADLSRALRSMIGEGGSAVVNAESGVVIVRGRAKELHAVGRYLETLSGSPRAADPER